MLIPSTCGELDLASLAEILELEGDPNGLQPLMYRRRGVQRPGTAAVSPVAVAVPAEEAPEEGGGRGFGHVADADVEEEECGDPASAWASMSLSRRSSSFWKRIFEALIFSSSKEKRASLASILLSRRASLASIFFSNLDRSGASAALNI